MLKMRPRRPMIPNRTRALLLILKSHFFIISLLRLVFPPQLSTQMHGWHVRQPYTKRLAAGRPSNAEQRASVIYGPKMQKCTAMIGGLFSVEWRYCYGMM